MDYSYEAVRQAKEELKAEELRKEVEEVKAKIRSMRKHRFPWRLRVKIINLNKLEEG
jgi:hypothetical protein